MGLLDPATYRGFAGHEWDLRELMAVFRREMRDRRLLLWGTGAEGAWDVDVTFVPTERAGEQETTGGIVCLSGRLCLVNYETLTMAAQFADVRLPEPHHAKLCFEAPAGSYRCRVVRRADRFLIELAASVELPAPWDRIPWSDSPFA